MTASNDQIENCIKRLDRSAFCSFASKPIGIADWSPNSKTSSIVPSIPCANFCTPLSIRLAKNAAI